MYYKNNLKHSFDYLKGKSFETKISVLGKKSEDILSTIFICRKIKLASN